MNNNWELKKDIKFLKEMQKYAQILLNRNDLISAQYLNKMIEDWTDELEEELNQSKEKQGRCSKCGDRIKSEENSICGKCAN